MQIQIDIQDLISPTAPDLIILIDFDGHSYACFFGDLMAHKISENEHGLAYFIHKM